MGVENKPVLVLLIMDVLCEIPEYILFILLLYLLHCASSRSSVELDHNTSLVALRRQKSCGEPTNAQTLSWIRIGSM